MKKKYLLVIAWVLLIVPGLAQNLAINADGSLPNANAILDIKSGNKGLLIPRMSSVARKLIPPTQGLLVYDTTTHSFWYHTGRQWQSIATSAAAVLAPGDAWLLNGNSGTDSSNFLGTLDNAPLRIRVNNLPSGIIHPTTNNVAWGQMAGRSMTTGSNNTALGNKSLENNTTGFSNTATGFLSLFSNTEGTANTAVGKASLYNNLNGFHNTAIGGDALHDNTGGYNNTSIGHISLYRNTTGRWNSAIGAGSLYFNTTGIRNVAAGYQSLYSTTTGSDNVASGYQALYSNTTGNGSTATGYQALYSNEGGAGNTGTGYRALYENQAGSYNTANGFEALRANKGYANTGIGYQALHYTFLGHANTAVGYQVLYNNFDGTDNTALGIWALHHNTSGSYNTAVGRNALVNSTSAQFNTAIGTESMTTNQNGSFNTAIGMVSLSSNTSGEENTAIGFWALPRNSTGSRNVAVGYESLTGNTTGSNNTAVGYRAGVTTGSSFTNATALGNGAIVDASNKVRIGNAAVTMIEGQVPFTTPSDMRFKFGIQDDVKGLDFIMQLRPVSYHFDVKRFDALPAENITRETQAAYEAASRIRRSGFLAQEVEQAAMNSGYDFSGIIKPKTAQEHYSLSYDAFVVPLVKGMQEQQQLIEAQNKRIEQLEKQLAEVMKVLKHKE